MIRRGESTTQSDMTPSMRRKLATGAAVAGLAVTSLASLKAGIEASPTQRYADDLAKAAQADARERKAGAEAGAERLRELDLGAARAKGEVVGDFGPNPQVATTNEGNPNIPVVDENQPQPAVGEFTENTGLEPGTAALDAAANNEKFANTGRDPAGHIRTLP